MELAMGAIGSVLPRLGELLKDEYILQKGVKPDIESLERELTAMHIALEKVAKEPPDRLEPEDRHWASLVRELSYDIDDAVDTFVVGVAGRELPDHLGILQKLARKTKDVFMKGKSRHKIADAIGGIKELAKEIAELRARYRVDGVVANHGAKNIDPRIYSMHANITDLVGIGGAKDELLKMLSSGGDEQKVISIVGFGGLGKTTIAKVVYDKLLKEQFDCGAFVSVGQKPDLKKVFQDTLYGIDKGKYENIHSSQMGERHLIELIQDLLQNKRYFIVIDDIWDEKEWGRIKCAFYKNNLGSRVITTTRKVCVSKACCSNEDAIYRMKPLSDDDSEMLFCGRIFSPGTGCPHYLEEVSTKILKKCGGVPLAIITMASLLANKEQIEDEWKIVLNSIGRGLAEGTVDDMKTILSFSYYDLPSHLKACLLCLSIFPEDYVIRKDHLINMWMAEGFIKDTGKQQEKTLAQVGESYFFELINRSLIQPGDVYYDSIISCGVHDMVLDLIVSLSVEENFVTILDQQLQTSSLGKIHRLSLQNSMAVHNIPEATVPKVRSLCVTGSTLNLTPAVSSYPMLRVLYLNGCRLEQGYHLKQLGKLFHLRYLRLSGESITELPKEIGNLQFLQSLDLEGSSIEELPPTIIQLRRLMFLTFNRKLTLTDGRIVALTSLQHVSEFTLFYNDISFLKQLGNLTELRLLRINLRFTQDMDAVENLGKSLCNLHKLRSLHISGAGCIFNSQSEWKCWIPPRHLHRLDMPYLKFYTPPAFINSSLDLPFLSYLSIWIIGMRQEHLEILGRLPVLRILVLRMQEARERSVVCGGAFPSLRECEILNYEFGMVFQDGGMPKVEELQFSIMVQELRDANYDCGLGNLPSLVRAHVYLDCEGAHEWEVEKVESVLKDAADSLPTHPYLTTDR